MDFFLVSSHPESKSLIWKCHSTLIIAIGFMLHVDTSYAKVSDVMSPNIQLLVLSSCENSSTLLWRLSEEMSVELCELTLLKSGHSEAEILDIYPESGNHRIQLTKLHDNQSYTAFLVCDGTKRTNNVNFIVGNLCENGNNLEKPGTNDTSRSKDQIDSVQISRKSTFTTVGVMSAILFSCIGATLLIVVAYYVRKKYQHRQRILRIFRQEQNDPFQALYSPTQDTYSF